MEGKKEELLSEKKILLNNLLEFCYINILQEDLKSFTFECRDGGIYLAREIEGEWYFYVEGTHYKRIDDPVNNSNSALFVSFYNYWKLRYFEVFHLFKYWNELLCSNGTVIFRDIINVISKPKVMLAGDRSLKQQKITFNKLAVKRMLCNNREFEIPFFNKYYKIKSQIQQKFPEDDICEEFSDACDALQEERVFEDFWLNIENEIENNFIVSKQGFFTFFDNEDVEEKALLYKVQSEQAKVGLSDIVHQPMDICPYNVMNMYTK